MNVFFGTSHIQTLKDLQEIAEKHNCRITCGINSQSGQELESEILAESKIDKRIIDKLEHPYSHDISIKREYYQIDKLWFELYDNNNGTYHSLAYMEMIQVFDVEKDFDFDSDKERLLNNFLEEHGEEREIYEDSTRIVVQSYPTIIYGFGYKGKHKDGRVYREGMALKFFGDLVCKYLKEPNISRVY